MIHSQHYAGAPTDYTVVLTTFALGGGSLFPCATLYSSQPHKMDQIHPIRIASSRICRMATRTVLQLHATSPAMRVPTPGTSVDENRKSGWFRGWTVTVSEKGRIGNKHIVTASLRTRNEENVRERKTRDGAKTTKMRKALGSIQQY